MSVGPPLPSVPEHPSSVDAVEVSPPERPPLMWERPESLQRALEQRLLVLGETMLQAGAPPPQPFTAASQAPLFALGVLTVAEEERAGGAEGATAHNLVLQGEGQERVRLDLTEITAAELFAGQVVGVEGRNPYGTRLIANSLHFPPPPPPPLRTQPPGSLSLLVAAGPFTPSSDLSYEPLHDLLGAARTLKADAVLLIGPHVDSAHPLVPTLDVPFGRHYEITWGRALRDLNCPVLLVPSLRDPHVDPVLPQQAAPIPGRDLAHVHTLRNPAHAQLNGLAVSACSVDILWHLNRLAHSRQAEGGTEEPKRNRLLRSLLRQRSLYPLYPAPPSHAFVAEGADAPALAAEGLGSLDLPYLPDILVLPSALPPFAVSVDGVLCVNPGRLTRHDTPGTFAMVHVLKGDGEVAARTHVDIIRI